MSNSVEGARLGKERTPLLKATGESNQFVGSYRQGNKLAHTYIDPFILPSQIQTKGSARKDNAE